MLICAAPNGCLFIGKRFALSIRLVAGRWNAEESGRSPVARIVAEFRPRIEYERETSKSLQTETRSRTLPERDAEAIGEKSQFKWDFKMNNFSDSDIGGSMISKAATRSL